MKSIADIFRSYGVLDERGIHVGGTDKETNHRYGDAYERLFPNREAVRLMMEVGVADGSSLLAWSEVFPNAICVGIDIHPAARLTCHCHNYERLELFIGDATARTTCNAAAQGRSFDFICEDASHCMEDTLATLICMWKYVKPGGLYVIEECADIAEVSRITGVTTEIVNTNGPFGGIEPLVVLRKPI